MSPLERYYKLPQAKRDQLLHAARSEFAAHGFERASYNRIIEASGVSKGAMYYYFADKADLFGAVIDQLMQELIVQVGPLRQARDADDFWRAIAEWSEATMAVLLGDPELAALGHCLYGDSGAQQVVARLREQVNGIVVATLETGQRLAAVRTDVPIDMLATGLTYLLLGLDRWFTEQIEARPVAELEALAHKALTLCRDLAGAESEKRSSP